MCFLPFSDIGIIQKLKEKHMDEYMDFVKDFEAKKREISSDKLSRVSFRVPQAVREIVKQATGYDISTCIAESPYKDTVSLVGDKIQVDIDVVKTFYETAVRSIISHLHSLFSKPELTGCLTILMVGGFSESDILQNSIRTCFTEYSIIVPQDAGVAVLKGATVYGHDPLAIAQRVLKYTYGQKATHVFKPNCLESHPGSRCEQDDDGVLRCTNLFSVHARAGDTITIDQEQPERVYIPISAAQTKISCPLIISTERDPLVTDGCIEIGVLNIPIPNKKQRADRKFGVKFMFGKTEVKVRVVDKASGVERTLNVDCLE